AQIAYYSRIAGDLRFAIKADPRWIRETVDTGGVSGWYTGTAIDSRGLPHISYYDWTEGTLRQAEGAIALQVRTLTASQVDPSSATLRGELVALGIHPGVAVEFALYVRTPRSHPRVEGVREGRDHARDESGQRVSGGHPPRIAA